MTFILFLAFNLSSFAKPLDAHQQSIKATADSVKGLIAPLLLTDKKKSRPVNQQFAVHGCEEHKIDWMEVLMLKKSVELTYSFAKDCDIQGTISPMVIRPFPAELKLRNLKNFEQLKSENKITATLEARPVLMMEIISGELSGKSEKVKFTADYQVRINPLKPKDSIEENLGGVIRISEINGQKVDITEKILIQ
jgi:hypothetical protein